MQFDYKSFMGDNVLSLYLKQDCIKKKFIDSFTIFLIILKSKKLWVS